MKKILLLSSAVVIAALLFEAYRENIGNEWHHYQKKYKVLIKQLAKTQKERRLASSYEIKMRQVVLPDLKRIDRCISCHVGIEDPRMIDIEQPLTVHPADTLEIHELETIGCTVCHDGQGRAITAKEAHAVDIPFWEKSMLKEPFLQSNCFRCHNMDELPQLAKFHQGKEIFFSQGCLGCHKFEGKGGQLAPDLTNIADATIHLKHPVDKNLAEQFYHNFNIAYIYESIKEPKAQPEVTAMPDFDFSEDEIKALTVFLKSLSKRAVPASYLAETKIGYQPEDIPGEALYRKYCVACHGMDAKGGVRNINYVKRTVPALNTLAERMFLDEPENIHKVAELLEKGVDITKMSPPLDVPHRGRVLAQYRAIRNVIEHGSIAGKEKPEGPEPLLHMPSWSGGLTRKDIDSIINYLLTLYPGEKENILE